MTTPESLAALEASSILSSGRHSLHRERFAQICIRQRPSFTLQPDTADGKNAGDSLQRLSRLARPGPGGLFGHTAMDWVDRGAYQSPGMELLGHAGGAGSYHAWVGFDKKQRRGVVVLSTANDLSVEAIGWTLLQRLPLTSESKTQFMREIIGIGTALATDPNTGLLRITGVIPKSPQPRLVCRLAALFRGLTALRSKGKALPNASVLWVGQREPKCGWNSSIPNEKKLTQSSWCDRNS